MYDSEYMRRMLVLTARHEVREEIDWALNVGEDGVTFTVPVSGVFDSDGGWDAVPIRPSDVDQFTQALRDVEQATEGDSTYGPLLYACRTRRTRPSNQAWPADTRVHGLFEDALRHETNTTYVEGHVEPINVLTAGDGWPSLVVKATTGEFAVTGHLCLPNAGGVCACGNTVTQVNA